MIEPFWVTMLELLGVVGLIFANAFFVAAEFALVSVRRTRIEELITQGNTAAIGVKRAIADPDRFIAATQLGITIASLGLGWIGEPALAHLIEPVFAVLPEEWASPAAHTIAAGATAFAVITFLHVVLGELTPKSVALQYPVQTALWVARPTTWFENLFRPVIWALNGTGNALLRAVGLPPPTGHQLLHSVEELKMLVTASEEGGVLDGSERDMLHNVFEFSDRLVREVMIPRPNIVAVDENSTIAEFLQTFSQSSHARFPVYSGTIDNVIGFLAIKDVLRGISSQGASALERKVQTLVRQAIFVPESKRVGALFAEMQGQKIQLAVVIDEFGGTAGIIPMAELIEEIMGHLSDELAHEQPPIETIDEHTMQVDAQLRLEEVNDQLGIHLPESEDYATVAGFLLYVLRRIPKEGESVKVDNVKLTVTGMKGPKIEKVLITRL